jgi:hypothetical protein
LSTSVLSDTFVFAYTGVTSPEPTRPVSSMATETRKAKAFLILLTKCPFCRRPEDCFGSLLFTFCDLYVSIP